MRLENLYALNCQESERMKGWEAPKSERKVLPVRHGMAGGLGNITNNRKQGPEIISMHKGPQRCSFVGFSPRSNPDPNWIFLPLLF